MGAPALAAAVAWAGYETSLFCVRPTRPWAEHGEGKRPGRGRSASSAWGIRYTTDMSSPQCCEGLAATAGPAINVATRAALSEDAWYSAPATGAWGAPCSTDHGKPTGL